jgi:hypothetical protein
VREASDSGVYGEIFGALWEIYVVGVLGEVFGVRWETAVAGILQEASVALWEASGVIGETAGAVVEGEVSEAAPTSQGLGS